MPIIVECTLRASYGRGEHLLLSHNRIVAQRYQRTGCRAFVTHANIKPTASSALTLFIQYENNMFLSVRCWCVEPVCAWVRNTCFIPLLPRVTGNESWVHHFEDIHVPRIFICSVNKCLYVQVLRQYTARKKRGRDESDIWSTAVHGARHHDSNAGWNSRVPALFLFLLSTIFGSSAFFFCSTILTVYGSRFALTASGGFCGALIIFGHFCGWE